MKTLKKIFRTQVARMLVVSLLGIVIISLLLGLLGGVAIGIGVFIALTIIGGAVYGIEKVIDWVMDGDY